MLAAAAVVTLGAVSACGSGDPGEVSGGEVLKVAVLEPFSAYPLLVAESEGYLDEMGISQVELNNFTSIPAAMAAIAKDQMDTGTQAIPTVVNYNRETGGSKFKLVANFGTDQTMWSVRNGSDMPTADDSSWEDAVRAWQGKIVGVPALGGIMELELRYMLEQAGLNPDSDVQITAVGAQTSGVTSFQQGNIDVIGGGAPTSGQLIARGIGYTALGPGQGPQDMVHNIAASNWIATEQQLSDRSEMYAGLSAAVEKAREFIGDEANRDACITILVDKVGLDRESAEQVYDLSRPGIADGGITEESFNHAINALDVTGIMPKSDAPGYDELVATDIAE